MQEGWKDFYLGEEEEYVEEHCQEEGTEYTVSSPFDAYEGRWDEVTQREVEYPAVPQG